MADYQRWSYKVVWYVNYIDIDTGEKYPAFCVEPSKDGVGISYDKYDATITKESDNAIWRILNKGYMGTTYQDWNLECDDDLYYATKVAIHSYVQNISPKDKYIVGTRAIDGNTIEEIQRRGSKVLEVSQQIYDYGLNGTDKYVEPKVTISQNGNYTIEKINGINYYIQKYSVVGNKELKSYQISISNFVSGTKILNSKNQEIINSSENSFKIAIPIENIKQDISGKIYITNAEIKTNPIFHCKSVIETAQAYVTYISGYEKTNTEIGLNIKSNTSSLKIKKIDSQTKESLEGVVFQISDLEGTILSTVTTNEKGIAELKNISPQTVIVKEIEVPSPYILNEEEKQVQLKWGEESIIEFQNERIKGKIRIVKISEDYNEINELEAGTPIKNVKFHILDIEGNFIEELITDEEGIAESKDLEKGIYRVKEIETDENYELDDKEYEVEIIVNKEIINLIITNKSKEVAKLPRTGF